MTRYFSGGKSASAMRDMRTGCRIRNNYRLGFIIENELDTLMSDERAEEPRVRGA